jgi:maleylacetate reductase
MHSGLHHKLCHTLGGSFNLPHAEVHTVMLPHALAYNAPKAPQAMAAIAPRRADAGRRGPAHERDAADRAGGEP